MTASLTITAKTGPGIQATALVLTGLTNVQFDLAAGVVFVSDGNGQIDQFELTGVTTVTCTVTGTNYAFVVS